jgi:hypothetical protein
MPASHTNFTLDVRTEVFKSVTTKCTYSACHYLLLACSAYSYTLKMKTRFSETSATFYQTNSITCLKMIFIAYNSFRCKSSTSYVIQ